MKDWREVKEAATADEKADIYQAVVNRAIECFFPLKTVRRKNTDPPWLDRKTKKMIEDTKKLYMEEEGRTEAWKREKREQTKQLRQEKEYSLTNKKTTS